MIYGCVSGGPAGRCPLMADAPAPREKADLKGKLREVPHKPGVYLMRDRLNRVIYVGKARDLRKRLSSYFTPSRQTLSDLKTRALIKSIYDFDVHVVRNETESLLLEGKLIKEFRPKYNVSFRDDKRFLLLKVHLDDAWPKFQLSRMRKEDGARYFGPFAHSGALRTTVAWVNRQFGLRSCRPLEPGEEDYKHCNDDVIRNCTAPCIGKIDREDYLKRVEEACVFLEGKSRDLLVELEEQMSKAAANLQFERAAELRDVLDHLRKTLRPARRFTRTKRGLTENNEKDALQDVEELKEVIHLETAPMVMECFDISNISDAHVVASMVRFTNGLPDNKNYRRYRIRTVKGQDDFASMAEVVRRRYARILSQVDDATPEAADSQEDTLEVMRRLGEELEQRLDRRGKPLVRLPDLVIVDGGKGQLSSACKELQRLGLGGLAIVGLAKEHEEIYRPGISEPIILPHEMGALRLLQRIRDEAHRFANGYHQLLMKRRIHESILDDCPGVSERRKATLLKTFGSVSRLRKATMEEIAAVPGVSEKVAQGIVDYLASHQS
ncbi:excinuclease ABC subunit UvrC [Verrucomicrobiales bacterium]|nr:excinuclease ABC subunit UvrC [Verrucomicrobiales bacterium]